MALVVYVPDLAEAWHPRLVSALDEGDEPPPCGARLLLDSERYIPPDEAVICPKCSRQVEAVLGPPLDGDEGQPEESGVDRPT